LHEEEIRNLKKINDLIKDSEKEVKRANFQFKFTQDAVIEERIIDSVFFQLIESVNKKEIEVLSKTINLLREQQIFIERREEKKETVIKEAMANRKEVRQLKSVAEQQLYALDLPAAY
jgi:transcription initiation factor IIF auxiliary subunit